MIAQQVTVSGKHCILNVPCVGRHAPLGSADADGGGGDDASHAVPLPLERGVKDDALLPAGFAHSPIADPIVAVSLVLRVLISEITSTATFPFSNSHQFEPEHCPPPIRAGLRLQS